MLIFFSSYLSFCKFHNSDLRKVFFAQALIRHTDFFDVNFDQTEFGRTEFVATRFTNVAGLKTAKHVAPSLIDLSTLSERLPLQFMRGIGLTDPAIAVRSFLIKSSSQLFSCFISFSTLDQPFAERLHHDLQNHGVRCWFAPHDLSIGAVTFDKINEQITRLDRLLLILSAKSIASQWVEDEVTKAYAEERRRKEPILIPIRIDDEVMRTDEAWAVKLRDQRNIGNFVAWRNKSSYQDALQKLLRSLLRT